MMTTLRMLAIALTASVSLAAAGEAASMSLNLHYGLWEMSSAGTISGAPPIPAADLAKLTPAQRAQMAAVMASAMSAANKPHTFKSCITADSLQRGFKDPELSNGCTQTILSSTSTDMEVKVACTGRHTMDGTFQFQAASPEAINGTIDMSVMEGSNTMKINRTITGRWVGADCGKVKP
jgi:hypothetical protein